jgi:hypothetical protein
MCSGIESMVQMSDDFADLVRVRPRCKDPLLGLSQLGSSDHLHSPRYLLRVLDGTNSAADIP